MTTEHSENEEYVGYDIVKISLKDEVLKLAEKDGIRHPAQLQQKIVIRRYDRYADVVRAFYQGKDEGFAEGVLLVGRPYRMRLILYFLLGVAIGLTIMYIMR